MGLERKANFRERRRENLKERLSDWLGKPAGLGQKWIIERQAPVKNKDG